MQGRREAPEPTDLVTPPPVSGTLHKLHSSHRPASSPVWPSCAFTVVLGSRDVASVVTER